MKINTQTNDTVFQRNVITMNKSIVKNKQLFLGKTILEDDALRELAHTVSVIFLKNQKGTKEELLKRSKIVPEHMDAHTRFYCFLFLFQEYFNQSYQGQSARFQLEIENMANLFRIARIDRKLVAQFFQSNQAYQDHNEAVYFSSSKIGSSIKHLGCNILPYRNPENEITYLKYFKNYHIFLSKTYILNTNPQHFLDNVPNTEINLVTPENFEIKKFGYHTFNETVLSIADHQPLAYFELAQSAGNPKVVLDAENGKLIICGSSTPFSPTQFFDPILQWLQNYKREGKSSLDVYIMLDYFNTYTSKFLLSLCRACDEMYTNGCSVKIFWYYDPEDEDMGDFGEHLSKIFEPGLEYCLITTGIEELV